MLPQNPDPNINFFRDVKNGIASLFSNKLRSRYEILQEIGAPESTQSEMRELTQTLFVSGVSMGFTCGFVLVFALLKIGVLSW